MRRISTKTEKPSYKSLNKFQAVRNKSVLAVPAKGTNLSHRYIVTDPADFTPLNVGAWTPVQDPGDTITDPNPCTTAQTKHILCTASEPIRLYNHKLNQFGLYDTTKTVVRTLIINNTDDKYICFKRYPQTKIHCRQSLDTLRPPCGPYAVTWTVILLSSSDQNPATARFHSNYFYIAKPATVWRIHQSDELYGTRITNRIHSWWEYFE